MTGGVPSFDFLPNNFIALGDLTLGTTLSKVVVRIQERRESRTEIVENAISSLNMLGTKPKWL